MVTCRKAALVRNYVEVYWPRAGGLSTVYGHTYSKSMDKPGKVANPARGQLNRENEYSPVRVQFVPENLVSRDGFGSPVSRQPAHLHAQAESGPFLRDSSRVPRRRPYINLNRHTHERTPSVR